MLEQERKNNKWKEIVGLARKENMIGKSLLLYCQNHPTDKGITATTASDFRKAPEGGCMKSCEFKLRCGHVCTRNIQKFPITKSPFFARDKATQIRFSIFRKPKLFLKLLRTSDNKIMSFSSPW
jgi:hypothetical protein